jgi:hypothetical protein
MIRLIAAILSASRLENDSSITSGSEGKKRFLITRINDNATIVFSPLERH